MIRVSPVVDEDQLDVDLVLPGSLVDQFALICVFFVIIVPGPEVMTSSGGVMDPADWPSPLH